MNTRRSFLTTSALAGTWSLLAPHALALGANSEIRVCVIGFNGRGKNHISSLRGVKGCRIVALCDVDEKVLAQSKQELEKKNIKVETFTDYRKVCESKDIDAVSIATPNHTHALIALTAAAHGKHVYLEKPISHNVWEGRILAQAAAKYKVTMTHGFQRRSETSWAEAFDDLKKGKLGALKVARALCYKPRPSIGKVAAAVPVPNYINYDLWCGPREMAPVMRQKFHYDWHWQHPYGNGDLGNQGPHQLDVCRWAIEDPHLPEKVTSIGGRLGYDDDGDTPNSQIVLFEHAGKAPIIMEVRGLPKEKMNFEGGMDTFKGQSVGNVIEYDGGYLAGDHNSTCAIYDSAGKQIKTYKGSKSPHQNWIDSINSGKMPYARTLENAHYSTALAHLGDISLQVGKHESIEQYLSANNNPLLQEAALRLQGHLAANNVDLTKTPLTGGIALTFDPTTEQFTGTQAAEANKKLKDDYRKGFELPI